MKKVLGRIWMVECLFLLCIAFVFGEKARQNARSYYPSSSSSNSLSSSYGSNGNNNYQDNFDSMFDSMDVNKKGNAQRVKIALPNPPVPPRPPRPMSAPIMGNYENDPNNAPRMPRPPAPPSGFGPMDIEFQFPSYEPSVDDSFFDSDATNSLSGGGSYGGGSGANYGGNTNNNYNYNAATSTMYSTSSTRGSTNSYGTGGNGVLPAGPACSPISQPLVKNGVCVDHSLISDKCHNFQLAASSNCSTGQFCCFSHAPPGPAAGGSCSPVSQPLVKNGICVPSSNVSDKCHNLQLASSANCRSSQFCCFSNIPGIGSSGATCSPISQPAVKNGVCVNESTAAQQCANMQMAMSSSCQSHQFCCFSNTPPGNATTTTTQRIPTTSASPVTGSTSPGQTITPGSTPRPTQGPTAGPSLSPSPGPTPTSTPRSTQSPTLGPTAGPSPGSTQNPTPASTSGSSSSPRTTGSPTPSPSPSPSPSPTPSTSVSPVTGNTPPSQTTTLSPSSTTSAPSGTVMCTPLSNPTVTNGLCYSMNALTPCRGLQMAKSYQCNSSQFCCFATSVSPTVATTSGPASTPTSAAMSSSNPTPSSTQYSSSSSGQNQSPSPQSPTPVPTTRLSPPSSQAPSSTAASTGSSSGPVAGSTGSSASSTAYSVYGGSGVNGGSGNRLSIASDGSAQTCHPDGRPPSTQGNCVPKTLLSAQCRALSIAAKSTCGNGEFCCYSEASTIPKGKQACRSNSKMDASGQCIKTLELGTECKDRAASKSDDCPTQEWCCLAAEVAVPVPEVQHPAAPAAVSEVPQISLLAPTADTGDGLKLSVALPPGGSVAVSINQDQPAQQKNGQTQGADAGAVNQANGVSDMTKQNIVQPQSADAGQAGTTGNTAAPASCAPNENPGVKNGICLTMRQLSVQCVDKKASVSHDCSFGRFCCFEDTAAGSSPGTTGDLNNLGNNNGNIASQSGGNSGNIITGDSSGNAQVQANDQNKVQSSISSNTAQGSASASGQNQVVLSVSDNKVEVGGQNSQQAQVVVAVAPPQDIGSQVSGGQAGSSQASSVNMGPPQVVVNVENPPSGQSGSKEQQVSVAVLPTQSQNDNQGSTIVVASVQLPQKTCSPNSNQAIKDGHCMTIRELRSSCVDSKASPSTDCDMGNWCCFTDDSDKMASQPSDAANEVVTTSTTAASSTAGEAVSAGNQDQQQCSPNSKPTATDGICMPTRDLRVRCKNQRVSKSPSCKMGHWCCFTDSAGPAVTVSEFSRSINTL